MSDSVHRLGNAIVPGSINKDLIEKLEQLLEGAKNGEVVAGAYCAVYANDHIGAGWSFGDSKYWALTASVFRLYHRFVAENLLRND